MKIDRSFTLALTILFLSSCGGGGGSSGTNTNNTNQITVSSAVSVSSSSTSSASSIVPTIVNTIAPGEQSFTLDEDSVFNSEIKTNFDYVGGSIERDQFIVEGNTLKGGVITIVTPEEASDPKLYLRYTPAEDFNGDDEVTIYLTRFLNGLPTQKQAVKLNFHINPVADENLKLKINNEKVFTIGDQIRLSLPYYPDTNIKIPSDVVFKLSIGDIPVEYSIDSEDIAFTIPPEVSAGVKTLNVNFDYQNVHQHLTHKIAFKIDYGDIEYWLGDKSRPGTTYVVIAEKSVDQKQYLDWVQREFTKLLNEPLVSQYGDYWNLVVIKQPAPENYASVINASVSAILISDLKESGVAFIKKFVPNYDGVIVNTSLHGRATGGYLMTLNLDQIRTILHEFGHTHAKLADEYEDAGFNSNPIYVEGSNPNVTNFNSYDLIPWKHWILDPHKMPGVDGGADKNGVGAFLGAFYTSIKYYRPMYNSIMRDSNSRNAPFGPIYSEAWVLATYERMGILGSVTSAKNANLRTFNVAKNWNKNLTRIDWFIDDVKQDVWANQSTIIVDESKLTTNNYSIKAELTDLSGYIKNPHAYPAFKLFNRTDINYGSANAFDSVKDVPNENFQKQWKFEKSSASSLFKLQKQAGQSDEQVFVNGNDWVSHKVTIENSVHQLISSSRYDLQDTLRAVTVHSELRADVIDSSGRHLYSVGIDNPYRYYHDATGLMVLKGSGNYTIKHPYIKSSYQIVIVDMRTNQRVTTLDIPQ